MNPLRIKPWLTMLALLAGAAVQAQAPAAAPAPTAAAAPVAAASAAAVAPAQSAVPEPKPQDTNAQRAVSQPGNNAPFWRDVRNSGGKAGFTTVPAIESGTLVQGFVQYPGSTYTTAGEAWRQVRNKVVIPYGGALIAIVLLAIALFYWRRGSLGGHEADTGRSIERFTPFERAAHWANAGAFTVLAVSGLVMAFGKFFLLPIIGSTLFGWLTYALKNAHNFAGPLFAVSLVVVIATFIKDNFPAKGDLTWLLKGGGMFGGGEVPSNRFNAGEKVLFWGGVFVLGLVVVASGLVLDKIWPVVEYTRANMQVSHLVHASAALLMMALFCGHIYMGTLGVKGAFKAMHTGQVDEAWAKEHHAHWYEDIRAGRIPAQRSTPANGAEGGVPQAQV